MLMIELDLWPGARLTVPGEPVSDYLAVTPALVANEEDPTILHYHGTRWAVTHAPTGVIVLFTDTVGSARFAARLLAATDIDWNRSRAELHDDPVARAAVHNARAAAEAFAANEAPGGLS